MKKLSIVLLSSTLLVIIYGFAIQCNSAPTSAQNTIEANITPTEDGVGINIGDIAPEIEMANPDGKILKLSDLRGQVVLVDFWASWCGPCRKENPNVVAAYNKYKKAKFNDAKGFEIFNVSLDRDANAWKKGIAQDKLVWEYHVSDLKSWSNAAAATYKVRSIPTNFLLDADGKIIAKNLRGAQLHMAIDKLVKKL